MSDRDIRRSAIGMKGQSTMKQLAIGIGVAACSLTATAIGFVSASSSATAAALHPSSATHTSTFTSTTVKNISLDKAGHFVELSTDRAHGKLIGADSTTGEYHAKTGKVTGLVSFLRKNGAIDGTFTLDTHTSKLVGKITGGQGSDKGATGTFHGQAVNRTVTKVTLTLH
jgi:hypothetical protein